MKCNEIIRAYGTDFSSITVRLLEAADLIGEIRKTVSKDLARDDYTIAIKPNLVSPTPAVFGGTTHPEIVAGIIEYLNAGGIGPEHIVIMEGSWVGDRTPEAFDYCGYLTLSEKYGVSLKDMQQERRITRTKCGDLDIDICSAALEADYLINVPVLKGHCQTKVTCALKNMKGIIPNSEKRRFHRLGLHKPIACLNVGIRPDFIVIDHICGDPDFEEGGNPLVRNCVMAAKDPVLTDAYTCRVLGYSPDEVEYIGIAEELGVGKADLSKLVIKTAVGIPSDGEPEDRSGLTEEEMKRTAADGLSADGGLPAARKLVDIACAVDEIDSCSACYGVLLPVLDRLKNEGSLDTLLEKLEGSRIGIGQGHRGKSGLLGTGNCTSGFKYCIKGCPPDEDRIYQELKSFIEKPDRL